MECKSREKIFVNYFVKIFFKRAFCVLLPIKIKMQYKLQSSFFIQIGTSNNKMKCTQNENRSDTSVDWCHPKTTSEKITVSLTVNKPGKKKDKFVYPLFCVNINFLFKKQNHTMIRTSKNVLFFSHLTICFNYFNIIPFERIDKSKEMYILCMKCYLTLFLMNKHEMECKSLFLLKGRNISYFCGFISIQYKKFVKAYSRKLQKYFERLLSVFLNKERCQTKEVQQKIKQRVSQVQYSPQLMDIAKMTKRQQTTTEIKYEMDALNLKYQKIGETLQLSSSS
ncbi:hypothetical protein RFI_25898 [Reticulomyxa filosa]|uniref:Uncharacterized protein n=1 Tax=Reticulomyxa filosa TaxID=46433 RepID=X6MCV0_RETFI|nr:hypothetical protein RFI_25898 [Reticulomyxa filosa]|eukprot:ETO11476.1 hypothetical protein RFI_25898 [Reticulomyxa filosa]